MRLTKIFIIMAVFCSSLYGQVNSYVLISASNPSSRGTVDVTDNVKTMALDGVGGFWQVFPDCTPTCGIAFTILKLAHGTNEGAAVTVTTIGTGTSIMTPSIVRGTDGFAKIAWIDINGNVGKLYYTECTNLNCTNKTTTLIETVTPISSPYMSQVAVTSTGLGRLLWCNQTNWVLHQCLVSPCTSENSPVSLAHCTSFAASGQVKVASDDTVRTIVSKQEPSSLVDSVHYYVHNADGSVASDQSVMGTTNVGYDFLDMVLDGSNNAIFAYNSIGLLSNGVPIGPYIKKCTNSSCSARTSVTISEMTRYSLSWEWQVALERNPSNGDLMSIWAGGTGPFFPAPPANPADRWFVYCPAGDCSDGVRVVSHGDNSINYPVSLGIGSDGRARITGTGTDDSTYYYNRLSGNQIWGQAIGGSGGFSGTGVSQ